MESDHGDGGKQDLCRWQVAKSSKAKSDRLRLFASASAEAAVEHAQRKALTEADQMDAGHARQHQLAHPVAAPFSRPSGCPIRALVAAPFAPLVAAPFAP
eukprot:scaffold85_cov135-Skeletonema_marinoi.AAC.1